MKHYFKHPLLRKVDSVGSRRLICNMCDAYPFPHRTDDPKCSAFMKRSNYHVYTIWFAHDQMQWSHYRESAVLALAFWVIDEALKEHPEWLLGIVFRGRWIYLPKNLYFDYT